VILVFPRRQAGEEVVLLPSSAPPALLTTSTMAFVSAFSDFPLLLFNRKLKQPTLRLCHPQKNQREEDFLSLLALLLSAVNNASSVRSLFPVGSSLTPLVQSHFSLLFSVKYKTLELLSKS